MLVLTFSFLNDPLANLLEPLTAPQAHAPAHAHLRIRRYNTTAETATGPALRDGAKAQYPILLSASFSCSTVVGFDGAQRFSSAISRTPAFLAAVQLSTSASR